MDPSNDNQTKPQVRIRLNTRDGRYALADSSAVLVPTSFRRLALSTLVNGLLEHEKPIPFDFIIRGSYLRTSLEDFLSENGISSETIVEAEYVPAQKPPQYVTSFEHDDWVSAVDVLPGTDTSHQQPRILSASYDGHLRIWNTSSRIIGVSPGEAEGGHWSFVRDAKFVSSTRIVSVGFDRIVRLWKHTESQDGSSTTLSPQLELYGHTSSVDSVSAHATSQRLLTASSDNSVGFWSMRKSDAPAAAEDLTVKLVSRDGKRRKLNPAISTPRRGPLALMQQHTQRVTGVTFDSKDATVAYSTSWDQTVRTWDLVTASVIDIRTTNQALSSIEQMPELNLIAAGSAGRDIKLIDPRATATAVTAMTLRGHKNVIVSLARDPNNGYSIVSGSHDGTCRIWDLRNTRQSKDGMTAQSLYTIHREKPVNNSDQDSGLGAQLYSVHWDQELGILSGGEDKHIQMHRVGG